jgi:hypothetical protein
MIPEQLQKKSPFNNNKSYKFEFSINMRDTTKRETRDKLSRGYLVTQTHVP